MNFPPTHECLLLKNTEKNARTRAISSTWKNLLQKVQFLKGPKFFFAQKKKFNILIKRCKCFERSNFSILFNFCNYARIMLKWCSICIILWFLQFFQVFLCFPSIHLGLMKTIEINCFVLSFLQQFGTILDVEIIFNERGSKVCSFVDQFSHLIYN